MIDNNITGNSNNANNTEHVLKGMTLSCRYYTEVNSYKRYTKRDYLMNYLKR